MKNHIGNLLMLATICVGINDVSATNNTRHVYFRQVTPEFNEFLESKLPYIETDITIGGTMDTLSMADIQQARQNNLNGINVLNGVRVGDKVDIMGRIVTIVD